MNQHTIYLDGRFLSADRKKLESLAPGNFSGQGVFETMRADKRKVAFYDEHCRRMQRGLKLFGIQNRLSKKQIHNVIQQLFKKNNLTDARIRVAVWREKRHNHVSIVTQALPKISRAKYTKGYKVMISKFRRNPSRTSHVKSIDYAVFKMAYEEAKDNGYDEAVLLNDKNEIVECSRSNIFFMREDELWTPPVQSGCLNGIMRQRVLKLAKEAGMKQKIKPIKLNQIKTFDTAFLTNSLIEVMPVSSVV